MPRTKGETTKVVNAKTSSDSLRATVPSFIVKTLHLKSGDELKWEIESLEKGTIKVTVSKQRGEVSNE
jgi:antitoxin component of MazEF toxin-antitoxin module